MSVDMREVKRLEYRNGCYDSWVSVLGMEIRGYPRKWIHLRRASWWVGCRWRNQDWEIWWMLSAMRWNRMKCDGVFLVMKSWRVNAIRWKKKVFFYYAMRWNWITTKEAEHWWMLSKRNVPPRIAVGLSMLFTLRLQIGLNTFATLGVRYYSSYVPQRYKCRWTKLRRTISSSANHWSKDYLLHTSIQNPIPK